MPRKCSSTSHGGPEHTAFCFTPQFWRECLGVTNGLLQEERAVSFASGLAFVFENYLLHGICLTDDGQNCVSVTPLFSFFHSPQTCFQRRATTRRLRTHPAHAPQEAAHPRAVAEQARTSPSILTSCCLKEEGITPRKHTARAGTRVTARVGTEEETRPLLTKASSLPCLRASFHAEGPSSRPCWGTQHSWSAQRDGGRVPGQPQGPPPLSWGRRSLLRGALAV